MSARRLGAGLLAVTLVAIALSYCGGREASVPAFVSPEVCMALGHAEATAYALRALPPVKRSHRLPNGDVIEREVDVLRALEGARAAVVRVAVNYERDGQSHTSNGSGVLVAAGRFALTAGHVLAEVPDLETADIRLHLPSPGASDVELEGRVVDWRYGKDDEDVPQDWGLLRLVAPREGLPSVDVATTPSSSVLFCCGFPVQVGVDRQGRVVQWQSSRSLEPLLTVVERATEDRVGTGMPMFTPLAGCLTQGGQSGGPVFDASGAVTHLIAGTNAWWSDGQREHLIRGAPVEAALAALAAATK